MHDVGADGDRGLPVPTKQDRVFEDRHKTRDATEWHTGIAVKTDDRRETSVPGIYAAGDLANPGMASVTTASWQGAMAGISAQESMLA